MEYTYPMIADFFRRHCEGVFVNNHVAGSTKCTITPRSEEDYEILKAFFSMPGFEKVKYTTQPGGYAMVRNTSVTEIIFELGQNPTLDTTAWEMTADYERLRNLNNLDLRIIQRAQKNKLEQLKGKILKIERGIFTNKTDGTEKKYICFYVPQSKSEIREAQKLLSQFDIPVESKEIKENGIQITLLRCPIEKFSDQTMSIVSQLEDAIKAHQKTLFQDASLQWQPDTVRVKSKQQDDDDNPDTFRNMSIRDPRLR